jgi:hypothetical protein
MNFRKVNNITGWVILLIATATYTLTREATASFWDCGEFIACANEIGIPHPPGSPLFTMLGRLFILVFSGGDAANAASSVNLMSAVSSGFCVLFLFWTITHFARKMFVNHGENLTEQQTFTVMASGVVGALAYTFSDTFWFSAVEGEVYALSSFFTALIIWAMLKWEHAYELAKDVVERNRADRWIVFIFFMIGLSITVHLLNLLTLPAVVMIYFYKKYTPTVRKSIFAFLFSCVLTGAILFGMVYAIPRTSAAFDRLFVNSFDLPFFSGFTFFFILLGVLLWFLLKVARDRAKPMLRLAVWCFVFVMLGYSTYVTTLIRSSANPGIDMSNVDNPATLASYFAREQYGAAPFLKGPHFGSQGKDDNNDGYYDLKKGRMKWGKLGNKYVELGRDGELDYGEDQLMYFPRIWDGSEQQDHLRFYIDWLNKSPYQDATGRVSYDPPITYGDNFNFFFSYQMGLMYWRYFMWNFSGRQNDLQGFGNRRDGNWQTGISLIDKQMLGEQSTLPDSLKQNKANNKLYLLPFLLGILGCVYHFIKKKNDWVVNFLLFFFTGIAIGLYLNMPGNQPRERDYAFVGSFYAFAVWIGLAVTALVKLTKEIKQNSFNTIVYGSVLTFLISVFSMTYLPGSTVIKVSLMITAVYAILAAGLPALLKAISSKGVNERIVNIAASVICILVPILMANQEWDDHDRSKKTLARDDAKNYLESCAPNAILFCFGDNDTYPLWYAQEVEKVRPDIRIINTSLLGIDWYINQLRYKINQSDSVDVIWGPDKIIGDKLQYLQYAPSDKAGNDYYDLYKVMSGIGNQTDPRIMPIKRFSVPVDTALARKNGTLNDEDVAVTEMRFEIPNRGLTRDQLIILNVIATNQWKRPIYFTSTQVGLGLPPFMRREGLTYRLIPVSATSDVNIKPMYEHMMTKFANGHADVKGVYFDEENRRHLYQIRQSYADLARELLAKGEKDSAKAVVLKSDQLIPNINVPYGIPSRYEQHNRASWSLMEQAYRSGATDLANKISKELSKDLDQHMEYLASLGDMTKKQLEDILMNYSQQKYMEQVQEQQGGQPNRQADANLTASLSRNQSGLAVDMIQLFNLMQYVKRTDTDYNPAAKDTMSQKLDSLMKLDLDTNKLKGKTDSPKTTKPK